MLAQPSGVGGVWWGMAEDFLWNLWKPDEKKLILSKTEKERKREQWDKEERGSSKSEHWDYLGWAEEQQNGKES